MERRIRINVLRSLYPTKESRSKDNIIKSLNDKSFKYQKINQTINNIDECINLLEIVKSQKE